jgi:hypothetical protein
MLKMPETASGARARESVSGCKEVLVYKTFLGDRSSLCLLKDISISPNSSDPSFLQNNSHATFAPFPLVFGPGRLSRGAVFGWRG